MPEDIQRRYIGDAKLSPERLQDVKEDIRLSLDLAPEIIYT